MVRDALVDQMRLRAEQEKAKISELTADLDSQNAALAESAEEQKSKDTEIADLQRRLAAEEAKLKVADKAMESLTSNSRTWNPSLLRCERKGSGARPYCRT